MTGRAELNTTVCMGYQEHTEVGSINNGSKDATNRGANSVNFVKFP
jgi:hypothetical protein